MFHEKYLFTGIGILTLSLAFSLLAFFQFSSILRYIAFALIVISLLVLCFAMINDIEFEVNNRWLSWGLVMLLFVVYFMQRMEFHRFDFMVGDASDYFATGMFNVSYSQNVGYIVPYAATLTAIGYDIFGIEYVLLPYVVLYASVVPLIYFILRKLNLSVLISLLIVLILIFSPLSIWYAKSTFSETIWQVLLMMLMFNTYSMLGNSKVSWIHIFVFYTLLFISPLLRAEGILLDGLIIFLALFHFWKYRNLLSSLVITLSVFVVAVSAHWALILRPGYLLDRQYVRIIPHATTDKVMMIIYSVSVAIIVFIALLYFVRKRYSQLSLFALLTSIAMVLKPVIAYIFASRKDLEFINLFVVNEFEFAVGNFGMPIALLMVIGMFLLFYKAFRGQLFSLIIVMIYTILYIPYTMQAATFIDPHAFFLYWNRYYFSIMMIIHLLGLGLVLEAIYQQIKKILKNPLYVRVTVFIGFIVLVVISLNYKFYQIVINESHLKGSQHLYSWVKEHIPKYKSIALVTEKGVIYKQNARPDGLEQIEYFAGRGFSFFNIYEKGHQCVVENGFTKELKLTIDFSKVQYVLLLSKKKKDALYDDRLSLLDTFVLPLEWREHFGLDKGSEKIHQWDITKSIIKKVNLYATLYRIVKKYERGKKINFQGNNTPFAYLLKKGWTFIGNHSSAFASNGKGVISLSELKLKKDKGLMVTLRYAVINAGQNSVKHLQVSFNGTVLKEEDISSHSTREVTFKIPKYLLTDTNKSVLIIEVINQGQIMLRSIAIDKYKGEIR